MAKYMVELHCADGEIVDDDEVFETESEAYEYGLYLLSCMHTGRETLNLSNPGDYPPDDEDDEPEIVIVEIPD